MKLWEVWIIPVFYRRFLVRSDGRSYWVFRIDVVKRFPFIRVSLFKYENEMWDINHLLMQLRAQWGC